MKWYRGFYGSWNKDGVRSIGGSYSKAVIDSKARAIANRTGETVTIMVEKGMDTTFYEIEPEV